MMKKNMATRSGGGGGGGDDEKEIWPREVGGDDEKEIWPRGVCVCWGGMMKKKYGHEK